MEAKNLNNGMKNVVKNVSNGKKFYAAIINGNQMIDKDLVANVNNLNANLNINAEVANCEISQTDTSHFKLGISLPWGGEAKLEWNGSTQVASSVLAKQECAKLATERRKEINKDIEDLFNFVLKAIPMVVSVVKSDSDKGEEPINVRVKKEYKYIEYNWRRDYEKYVKFLTRVDGMEEIQEHESDFMKDFEDCQKGLAKAGALDDIQLYLLRKVGVVKVGVKFDENGIPEVTETEEIQTDEYGFDNLK